MDHKAPSIFFLWRIQRRPQGVSHRFLSGVANLKKGRLWKTTS